MELYYRKLKIAQEITQEKSNKNILEDKIAKLMREKPEINRVEIAQRLGITADTIKYRIDKMRKNGRIERQGSTKTGKWIVYK